MSLHTMALWKTMGNNKFFLIPYSPRMDFIHLDEIRAMVLKGWFLAWKKAVHTHGPSLSQAGRLRIFLFCGDAFS